MRSIVAQERITIRGNSSVASITQGEEGWLDLFPYQDVWAILDVAEASTGGGSAFQIFLETSPTLDDFFFAAMIAGVSLSTVGTTVKPILLNTATVPIARWFRWRNAQTGATGTWDVTFRLAIAVNSKAKPVRRGMRPVVLAPGSPCAGCGGGPVVPYQRRDPTIRHPAGFDADGWEGSAMMTGDGYTASGDDLSPYPKSNAPPMPYLNDRYAPGIWDEGGSQTGGDDGSDDACAKLQKNCFKKCGLLHAVGSAAFWKCYSGCADC